MTSTILSKEAAEALAIVLTIEDQRKSYRRMVQVAIYLAMLTVLVAVASLLV